MEGRGRLSWAPWRPPLRGHTSLHKPPPALPASPFPTPPTLKTREKNPPTLTALEVPRTGAVAEAEEPARFAKTARARGASVGRRHKKKGVGEGVKGVNGRAWEDYNAPNTQALHHTHWMHGS